MSTLPPVGIGSWQAGRSSEWAIAAEAFMNIPG
jgi:hypothetical protein